MSDDNNIANLQAIFKLADYIKKDPEYIRLVPDSGQSYTTIKIGNVPEVFRVKHTMSRMTNVFTGKKGINNRFTNYLISEFGINYIKANWAHTLELKKLVQQINFYTSINYSLNLDLHKTLLTGAENNGIVLFMSHRQRDDMKLIHELIGGTEGSIAYVCILSAIDNTFGRFVHTGSNIDSGYLEFDYFNGSLIDSINTDVQKFAETLYPYIKYGREYLSIALDDHNSKKNLLSDSKVKYILNVLEKIDKEIK